MSTAFKKFFFPEMKKTFLVRVFIVIILSYIFFSFICLPFIIKGHSMEPTYMNNGFNLCFRLKYLFSEPKKNDVVVIRLAGKNILLLKRVVALAGDIVEFRNGVLFVNGEKTIEDYVIYPSDWNLSPRKIGKNHVYVVGDNRSVPIQVHRFGQTPNHRIIGAPLW